MLARRCFLATVGAVDGVDVGALLLGCVLASGSMAIAVPQVVKTLRSRDVAGLSLTSAVGFAAGWSMWLVFSVSISSWPQVATQGLGLVLQVALIAAIVRALVAAEELGDAAGPGRSVARRLGVAGLASGVGVVGCVGVGVVGGWTAFAVAVAVYDAVFIAPQVRAVVGARVLSGLSVSSLVMRLAFSSGWLVYAVLIGRPEAAGSSLLWWVFSVYVLARLGLQHRARPHADVVA